MTVEQTRELLGFSFADFEKRLPAIDSDALNALLDLLRLEGSNLLTEVGTAAINKELERRGSAAGSA